MRKLLIATTTALVAFVSAPGANADTFEWSWSGLETSGEGTLDATFESGTEYLVTSITGSLYGGSVSLIAPGAFSVTLASGLLTNDNQLFCSALACSPDSGIGIALNGGTTYLLDLTAGGIFENQGIGLADVGTLTVTPDTPVATPLPAALPLLVTGLCTLGLVGWRRKRKARTISCLSYY
jgi:hypothetical protein